MVKHTGNNAVNSVEKTVEQRTVIQKENTEILINGEDAMTMLDVNQLKGHTGRAIHGIYLLPQVGQKRLWQRKGTNLSFPQ